MATPKCFCSSCITRREIDKRYYDKHKDVKLAANKKWMDKFKLQGNSPEVSDEELNRRMRR